MENLIHNFNKLELNWDGYGGLPISHQVIKNALEFIRKMSAFPHIFTPEVSPKSNGTISFVWQSEKGEAYIEIGNTRFSGYLKLNASQIVRLFDGRADAIDSDVLEAINCHLFAFDSIGYKL